MIYGINLRYHNYTQSTLCNYIYTYYRAEKCSKTHLYKLDVSRNLSHIWYCAQSDNQFLRPGTCSSRKLRFWSCCCEHISGFLTRGGAYTSTQVRDVLNQFANKTSIILLSLLYIFTLYYVRSAHLWFEYSKSFNYF